MRQLMISDDEERLNGIISHRDEDTEDSWSCVHVCTCWFVCLHDVCVS